MRKALSLGILVCGTFSNINAQEAAEHSVTCAQKHAQNVAHAKITVASPAEDEYDMKYVKFNLNVTNTTTTISGDVTTAAKVVVPSMSAYVFELHNLFIIDSVLFNGQKVTVSTSGYVRTITLLSPLPMNSNFTAQVFYHGNSGNTQSFQGHGIRRQQSPTYKSQVTYTLSEPYGAKDWWPTKQSLTDKIDSADIWVTVADSLKVGSNGVLKNVTPMPNNKNRYEWSTRIPIDYYLLSFAAGPYIEYSTYVHFPNSTDSMLFQNYIYNNPAALTNWKQEIDSVPAMITHLSQLFGRYPFWKEKYGHSMAPLGGGMEHQTMTTQGTFATTLSVHELGHQWFGDNVTCASWKDIWLNEGFASYSEYLYKEHFWTPSQAFNHMLDVHNDVMQDSAGSVYVDDTTTHSRIFDSRLTYDKGAAIVHSLRFMFNNDSLFFAALRTYQNTYKNGTATTENLKQVTQQVLGRNLDTFYQQWIYKAGYPVYSATWNQIGNSVIVKLEQTTTDTSVTLFHTPLELRLYSGTGDTIIRVENNKPSQTYYFQWNETMAGMFVDPNDWILDRTTSITKDITLLGVGEVAQGLFRVYPNPTSSDWKVVDLQDNSALELTDMNGRVVYKARADKAAVIPAAHLAPGIYLLRVSNSRSSSTVKLSKQ